MRAEEIRSAVLLGLFGFVVWPLLPNRYVDPWSLLQPREAWVTVVVVACIGFINYVLLRIYGRRGIALTALLGGFVNSTAAVAELSTSLPAAGLIEQTIPAALLTSVAMFARNALLLAVFARSAVQYAVLPLLAMMLVAVYFVYRHHHRKPPEEEQDAQLELDLASPVSARKVLSFGLLFLIIQMLGTLGARWLGNGGILLVSVMGGTVSSASTTAAAANLITHHSITALLGATATVLTSITSTAMNLPLIRRHIKVNAVVREIMLATALQATAGILVLLGQAWLLG